MPSGHWTPPCDGMTASPRAINKPAKTPMRCPVSQEDSEALGCEVRLLLYGKRRGVYRILFSIVDDTAWVLRIRHSALGPLKS
jgi:hypothetical protein